MHTSSDLPSSKRLIQRLSAYRFITTSLVIHLAVISLLGGVILFKAAQHEESFVTGNTGILAESLAEEDVQADPQEFEEPENEPSTTTANNSASAISSLIESASTWSVSAPRDQLLSGSSFGTERTSMTSSSLGGTGRSIASGRGMRGKLFGAQIESRKLGVVLDVSGSAHPILQYPLKEIDRNFETSVIVLYPGCGMKVETDQKAYATVKGKSIKVDDNIDKSGARTTMGQIIGARRTNPDLDDYLKRILKRDTVFIVDTDDNALIYGVHFAFEHLIKEGVDTIYWFADYEDELDPNVLEPLLADLKRHKIKVVCHNFAGKFPDAKRKETVERIARETGGQVILSVIGNR